MLNYRMTILVLMNLDNDYTVDDSNDFDDSNNDTFAEVNVLIEWLNVNRPYDMDELNELRCALMKSRIHEDAYGHNYSTVTWHQKAVLIGPKNMLITVVDGSIDYLMDLVEGLEIEMKQRDVMISA
jgi:hypothetical protein